MRRHHDVFALGSSQVGPGKTVGIVGIRDLGHLAFQRTVALGAEACALTHLPSKKDDCKKLGAKDVITTTGEN